jgi:conjugal transfer ATP-binding protein TraC
MDNTAPADGEYGEIFIMTDKVQTKGRVVLDKFLQTLLFTDADLRSKMNSLVSQGMSHLDVVKHILEDKH